MSKFLFDVQQKNRLQQKGLLRRFSITCYGHQESVEEMRAEKAEKYKELKKNGNSKEYEEWFLNYKPDNLKNKRSENNNEDTVKKQKNIKNKNTKKTKKTKKSTFAIYGGRSRTRRNRVNSNKS